MDRRRLNSREVIGLFASFATAFQSFGLAKQLFLAWTEGTSNLALSLFLTTFIGASLWTAYGLTKPAQLIIAVPNALNASLSFVVCIAIVISPTANDSAKATIRQDSAVVAIQQSGVPASN